ncbi:MAG: hypothetical protein ABSA39_05270 [Edaphobacter sp.]
MFSYAFERFSNAADNWFNAKTLALSQLAGTLLWAMHSSLCEQSEMAAIFSDSTLASVRAFGN